TNISSTVTYINNLKVGRIKKKEHLQVTGLPAEPRIAHISWSPDERTVAFTHTSATGVELWVLDMASAKATKLTGPTLNANMGNPVTWFRNSR
ncbi:hypothetical protein, partial [Klebsiella pneumoniae]|uniref:hypothetical protein n=1 Tax=Klebsiella pneumoniae TaxID=573 RepID=UPI0022B9F59E